jgi:hypothetical protein
MAQACSRSPDGGKPLREFAVKALYSRFRGNDDENHMTTEASHVELPPPVIPFPNQQVVVVREPPLRARGTREWERFSRKSFRY